MDFTSVVTEIATLAPRITFPSVRFGAETVLIGISILFNLLGIFVVYRAQKAKASVYHMFYFNLACYNIAACPLSWMCNNLLFIFNEWFSDHLFDPISRCTASVYVSAGVFVSLAIGIQMTSAMVGLGMVQYFAICQPLKSLYMLQRKRTFRFMISSFLIGITCAGLPLLVLSLVTSSQPCSEKLYDNILLSVIIIGNTYMIITASLYVLLMVMACRVYAALKKYVQRVGKYNADKDKLEQDKKAFQTTMILLLSVTLFTVPLNLYFLISLNIGGIDGVLENLVLFYAMMMPCTKCIADPIIYGSRMREVANEWRRVLCCEGKGNAQDLGNAGTTDESQTANRNSGSCDVGSVTVETSDGFESPKVTEHPLTG